MIPEALPLEFTHFKGHEISLYHDVTVMFKKAVRPSLTAYGTTSFPLRDSDSQKLPGILLIRTILYPGTYARHEWVIESPSLWLEDV